MYNFIETYDTEAGSARVKILYYSYEIMRRVGIYIAYIRSIQFCMEKIITIGSFLLLPLALTRVTH